MEMLLEDAVVEGFAMDLADLKNIIRCLTLLSTFVRKRRSKNSYVRSRIFCRLARIRSTIGILKLA